MPNETPDLEQLCSACGLCCDGSLFTHVTLRPGEAERLGPATDIRLRKDGAQVLMQPCGALSGKCCTVYAARPAGCRDFVCSLWRALEGGEARLDEAMERVTRAHELISRIGLSLPEARTALRSDEGAGLADEAKLALRLAEDHLRFHFGWKG